MNCRRLHMIRIARPYAILISGLDEQHALFCPNFFQWCLSAVYGSASSKSGFPVRFAFCRPDGNQQSDEGMRGHMPCVSGLTLFLCFFMIGKEFFQTNICKGVFQQAFDCGQGAGGYIGSCQGTVGNMLGVAD